MADIKNIDAEYELNQGVGVFNKWKLLFSKNGAAMVFWGMAILAMAYHGLEARATLHEYILSDDIKELLKCNDKGIWRPKPRDSSQYQISLFNP